MMQYILRRLLWVAITLGVVSLLTFVLVFATGDPALMLTPTRPGQMPNPKLVALIRQQYGLDQPLYRQYLSYMGNLLRGNLGDSYYFRRPVAALLAEKLPTTALMAGLIMGTALGIGIPLGVLAAVQRNTFIDRSILIFSTVLISAPTILLAVLLIYFFAYRLPLFPLSGTGSIRHWVLPTLSVALPIGVGYAIFLRTTMLSMLSADYVRTAQSKGLARGWIHLRHVLPNALIPVVTLASLDMAGLLTGVVLVEQIFSIPGLGQTVFKAVQNRDVPVVMGQFSLARF
jgi:peptide/nickel transport system permease protein